MIGDVIKITSENVKLFDEILFSLKLDQDRIIQLTREYPIEFECKCYRCVFTCESDVHDLIKNLENKIKVHKVILR